ncbi:MAG: hypothetical protein WCA36_15485 [Pseudolabrys sp.]
MTRIAYVILCSCLIVVVGLLAQSAKAGDREDGAYDAHVSYRPHHSNRAWFTSTCCYLKIVRHAHGRREVRYMRVRDTEHSASRFDRDKPRRHVEEDAPVYHRKHCTRKRVRVLGVGGRSVWALTARCYR